MSRSLRVPGLDDDLLLSIALDPGDDSLRRIYADRLLERGQGWGEFIHLQLLPKKTKEQAAREAELYGLAEAWLPDVMRRAVARGSSRWERGFLVSCTVVPNELPPAMFHPAWATVRALHRAPPELAASCPNLERWTGVPARNLGTRLPKLKVLGLTGTRSWQPRSFDAYPALEELQLDDEDTYAWYPADGFSDADEEWRPYYLPRNLEWLQPVSARLKTLRLHDGYVELEEWLQEIRRRRLGFSTLARRSTGAKGWELELEQTAPNEYGRVRIRTWAHGRPPREAEQTLDLERMLCDLPARWFSDVTIYGPGWKGFRRLPCFAGAKFTRENENVDLPPPRST